jgi:hypothetical protein
VLAIEAEVARGLARLTALSGMTEPQRQKLTCAYCRWDRQPRHTVECCLHKPGCCVCGQAHKGRDCDHLPADVKAAQEALRRARALKRQAQIERCTLRWRSKSGESRPRRNVRPARSLARSLLCVARG